MKPPIVTLKIVDGLLTSISPNLGMIVSMHGWYMFWLDTVDHS